MNLTVLNSNSVDICDYTVRIGGQRLPRHRTRGDPDGGSQTGRVCHDHIDSTIPNHNGLRRINAKLRASRQRHIGRWLERQTVIAAHNRTKEVTDTQGGQVPFR